MKITLESARSLLSLADKYDIKDLVNLCCDFMNKNIALAGKQGHLLSWVQYAGMLNSHQELAKRLKNFLRLNLTIFSSAPDFIDIDPNSLAVLLQQNNLVVKDESEVLRIAERWLMLKQEQLEKDKSLSYEDKLEHIKSLIEQVCSHVRFPMMSLEQLASIPLMRIAGIHKEFFCDKMALGMYFHANQPIKHSNVNNMQYTPRLYTSDHFCLEMEITEIQTVESYKSFMTFFSSLSEFPFDSDTFDDTSFKWIIKFYPRGVRYDKMRLISPYNSNQRPTEYVYIPESFMNTVRVNFTCFKEEEERRWFKVMPFY